VIPLAVNGGRDHIGLLRWPTPPSDFALPVVRCSHGELGVGLRVNSCAGFVARAVANAGFSERVAERDGIRAASSLEFKDRAC
jgi:hypothetical protein